MSEGIDWSDARQVSAAIRWGSAEGAEPNKTAARNVFAVDLENALKACNAGLAVGVSYLVLAAHSSKDNVTTLASANAIEKAIGIHHLTACKHIGTMQKIGLAERIDGNAAPRSRPVYRLPRPAKPELVWLPNGFALGGPLKALWRFQNAEVLRCCIELYSRNFLPTDGGIARATLRLPFDRLEVARHGQHVIWGFRQQPEQLPVGDIDAVKHYNALCELGLVGQVPHLFLSDDPDVDCIHAYGTERQTGSTEDMLGAAAHATGLALLSEGQRRFASAERLWLAPVHQDIRRVTMLGIARLRHMPETQTMLDWRKNLVETAPQLLAEYESLAAVSSARMAGIPTTRLEQGYLKVASK